MQHPGDAEAVPDRPHLVERLSVEPLGAIEFAVLVGDRRQVEQRPAGHVPAPAARAAASDRPQYPPASSGCPRSLATIPRMPNARHLTPGRDDGSDRRDSVRQVECPGGHGRRLIELGEHQVSLAPHRGELRAEHAVVVSKAGRGRAAELECLGYLSALQHALRQPPGHSRPHGGRGGPRQRVPVRLLGLRGAFGVDEQVTAGDEQLALGLVSDRPLAISSAARSAARPERPLAVRSATLATSRSAASAASPARARCQLASSGSPSASSQCAAASRCRLRRRRVSPASAA